MGTMHSLFFPYDVLNEGKVKEEQAQGAHGP